MNAEKNSGADKTEVDMRGTLWNWLRAKHPEGMLLTRWLLTARAILYPLDFIYWRMSMSRGYQLETDTWKIYGVRYSASSLRWLAEAQGETFLVTRNGDTVTLERVHNAAAMPDGQHRRRLKPCPFCGSAAEINEMPHDGNCNDGAMFVMCCNSACMASSSLVFPIMEDAKHLLLERWNKRAELTPNAELCDGESVLTNDWL